MKVKQTNKLNYFEFCLFANKFKKKVTKNCNEFVLFWFGIEIEILARRQNFVCSFCAPIVFLFVLLLQEFSLFLKVVGKRKTSVATAGKTTI